MIRSDPVVGVHEDHEFAPCVVQSEISGCADTAVGDVEYADAFVLFSVTGSQIAPEPSVDPSSMSSNSKSVMLCERMLPIHSSRYCAVL